MSLKAKVKQEILKRLIHKCDRAYDRTYQYAKNYLSYNNLISYLEDMDEEVDKPILPKDEQCKLDTFTCSLGGSMDRDALRQKALASDYVILCDEDVFLHVNAKDVILHYLSENPQACVLYGDEDVIDANGIRTNPWFKPDWSPTLFLSQFYFGGLVVVKAELLTKALECYSSDIDVRHLVYEICKLAGGFGKRKGQIAHINRILVHHPAESSFDKYAGGETLEYDAWKSALESGVLEAEACACDIKVSIVIPSKDQVDVLAQNLKSLEQTVHMDGVEVVVVDNGSTQENKSKTERLIRDLTFKTKYIYQPMEFNFSAMCNIGAKESQGEYLLFLNDDIEAVEEGWLEAMLNVALREYVGCVGAKLLYPGSNKIQHVGVINVSQGPIHKLQYQSDEDAHYFGWNKTDRECLAVTGACMMIKRKLFDEAGGFDEELSVTFNDIDLCYKLYAKGLYNVCLNSISLYHHESLSRGVDESKQKKLRLARERSRLYERHAALAGKDPFYHRYLNRQLGDLRVEPALEETLHIQREVRVAKPWTERTWKDARRHEGVRMNLEEGTQKGAHKGYLLMLGDDNACYEKRIILTNVEMKACYWCALNNTIRDDVEQGMPDQVNVGLSGYDVSIVGLPAGEYEVKAVAHNKISGVSYWKETDYKVSITEE